MSISNRYSISRLRAALSEVSDVRAGEMLGMGICPSAPPSLHSFGSKFFLIQLADNSGISFVNLN